MLFPCECGLLVNLNGMGWVLHRQEHVARMQKKQEPASAGTLTGSGNAAAVSGQQEK